MLVSGVQVLHLTDLHLSADPQARLVDCVPEQGWRRVLEACRVSRRQPDLVIVSGDLSEDGSVESYRRIGQGLREFDAPVIWTAGNHDDRKNMDATLASLGDFRRRIIRAGAWQVVTLDSQVVGESHGELAEAELAMLDRALASHPTSPVLVVLHHGPHAVCAMEACQLRNPAVLLERLQRHAAPVVVVSGHNHCEADVVRKGIRSLVTPSTCIQLTHPISEKAAASGDFMAVHQLDCGRVGMRWLTLREDGACDSEVVWLPLSATGDTTT